MKKSLILATFIAPILFACDEAVPNDGDINTSGKVIVLNEGQFNVGDAEVSVINTSLGAVENDQFFEVNQVVMGDILQNATQHHASIYFVMNNSNTVHKVKAENLDLEITYDGFTLPSGIAVEGDYMYVTEWMGFGVPGQLSKVNLSTGAKEDSLALGKLPGQPLLKDNMLWVPNSSDSTVSVIRLSDFTLNTTLTYGDNPNSLVEDYAGNVWVLYAGKQSWTGSASNARLVQVNATTFEQMHETSWPHNDLGVRDLCASADGKTLAYVFDGVKLYDAEFYSASGSISENNVYGLGVNPSSGEYYLGISPAFDQAGYVLSYDVGASLVDSFQVGVGPNGFIFN